MLKTIALEAHIVFPGMGSFFPNAASQQPYLLGYIFE